MMKMRKCFGLVLVLSIVVSGLNAPTMATELPSIMGPASAIEWVTGRINETISPGKVKKLGPPCSLEAGETVNFRANYSPRSANVDFGLVDSNNTFIYINVTNGSIIDGVIPITMRGRYTVAVRNNNTLNEVTVFGYVEC